MATINHSSGADIIVPSNNGTTYRGLGGDDTYILSNSIAANAAITIVDTSGANKIQLVDGLSIASSKFAADAVQLTLSNGAVVTINGASNFTYDLGGNATAGVTGSSNTLSAFAASMGVATLPTSGSTAGSSDVTINNSGISSTASPTYTVTKDTAKVVEGGEVTFTITASSAVSADTSFSWSVMGDTNGSTVAAAANADITTLSGTATIASGATSTTFKVGAVTDSTVEGLEGIKVSIFDSNATALSSDNILIDNAGSSATSQSYTGTTGVNNFTGGAGDDSFDFSLAASFQDIDKLDGGDGSDTLTVKVSTATSLKPELENIENVTFTNTAAATNDLTINAVDTASGYDNITNVSSTGGLILNNLQSLPSKFTINNAGDTMVLDFEAAAVAGDADNLHINLTGTGTTPTLEITADGTGDIETVTLNSTAQANTLTTLTTADVDPSKLVVTGDQGLTITDALSAEITTVDASAMTGVVGLTLSAAPGYATGITFMGGAGADAMTGTAGIDNVTGGAGNDTITMTALAATDTIDGGDGADTLSISQTIASATVLGGVSNVETLAVTGANNVTLAAAISATTFNLADTDAQVLTLDQGYTGATTVVLATYLGGDSADSADGVDNAMANVELTVMAESTTLDTELTLTGGTGTDTLQLYPVGKSGTAANDYANTDEVTDSVSGFENFVILDNPVANAATSIDFGAYDPGTGKNITIDSSALGATDAALTIDASAITASATTGKQITFTGGANATNFSAGNDDDTITTGAGNDTVAGTAGSNTINTGAGVDSIDGGTGNENINAGAGNDTIDMAGNTTALDTIDGGDGTDTLITSAAIASSTILGGVSNVEILSVEGDGIAVTLAADVGPAIFYFTDADGQTLTLNTGYTQATSVYLTGDATNTDTITNSAADVDLTVYGNAADFDSGTTITGGSNHDELVISQGGGGTALVDAGYTGIDKITITDKAGDNTSDVTLTMSHGYATAVTVDASALDAGEDATLNLGSAAAAVTITSGGGADIITGGNLGDTIDSGTGADVVNGGTGLDNITTGDGNDKVDVSAAAAFYTTLGTDTVSGGAGNDELEFDAAVTLTTARTANISGFENLDLTTGSNITVNDAFLAANPGIVIKPGANGTIQGSTATGDSLTTSLNVSADAAGVLSVLGGTGDDTVTFTHTNSLTALDTVNGGAGTDTIYIRNDNGTLASVATTAVVDVNVSNVERIEVLDFALDDGGGSDIDVDMTITINAGYTGAALTIDGSSQDMHPTALAGGEGLNVDGSNNLATEVLTLIGGGFDDSLKGGAGADDITGGAGADLLYGEAGNDVISGGTGADTIEGGTGIDNLSGGAGNDVFKMVTHAAFQTNGGAETIDGGAGNDTLEFYEAASVSVAAPEMEKVSGIESIVFGTNIAANLSELALGNGFFTSNGSSSISVTANAADNATSETKVDLSAVSNGSVTFYPNNANGAQADSLYGGSGDDVWVITGAIADTSLDTGDVFDGNGGTDSFSVVNSADTTTQLDFATVSEVEAYNATKNAAATSTVTLTAVATTTVVPATFTVDWSAVTSTAGILSWNDGNTDTITTAFTITGGYAADIINGSKGADIINGGYGLNVMAGNTGNDSITGGALGDDINGNAGADTLVGGGGADTLVSGAGNDSISGGDAADIITGGSGMDTITTGAGNDTVIYTAITESAGSTADVITDFTSAADNIRVTHTLTKVSFVLTDRGDVTNSGDLPGIFSTAAGDAGFISSESAFGIDFDADGIVNTNDFKVALTGATGFTVNDLDMYLTAPGINSQIIKTAGGNDSITGTNNSAQNVKSYAGNDTIDMVDNTGTVAGGLGDDTIAMGAAGDASYIFFDASDGADSVTEFTDGEDFLVLEEADTTDATDGAAAVIGVGPAGDNADGAAYDVAANNLDTAAFDILELSNTISQTNAANSDLYEDYTNENAAALFESLTTAIDGQIISGITVDNAGDKFFILAYEADGSTDGAHLYHANSAAVVNDTLITLNEVSYVAYIAGITNLQLDDGEILVRSVVTGNDEAVFG